jgi:hypothetical protein
MELEQQSEPRKVPYPLVFVSIISGAFFLLGVGVSAYTLTVVEASQNGESNLNIARFAEAKQIELGLVTDVYIHSSPLNIGTISFEYPTGFTEAVLAEDKFWLKELSKDKEIFKFAVNTSADQTHLQTATTYANKIGKPEADLELIDSGETATENLLFGIYAFKFDDVVYRVAVVDVTEDTKKAKVRLIIVTNESTQTLITLINKVNLTK